MCVKKKNEKENNILKINLYINSVINDHELQHHIIFISLSHSLTLYATSLFFYL